jgi:hypothetical protein
MAIIDVKQYEAAHEEHSFNWASAVVACRACDLLTLSPLSPPCIAWVEYQR